MKKILFVLAAIGLLAAGCNSSSKSGTSYQNPPQTQNPGSQAQVNVNNPDDAVNLFVSHSSAEQSAVAGSDDSDLTTSDSANLNSLTEVPNGN